MSKEQGAELEMEAYLRNYRNAGLMSPNRGIWQQQAFDSYTKNLILRHEGIPIGIETYEKKWWHFLYRIPRAY
jgi:hypothetical protein